MAKIILNANTEAEMEVSVDSVVEDSISGILSGNKATIIPANGTFPVIPTLVTKDVSTVSVETDDGINIPLSGSYNKVSNYSSNYYESDRTFAFHISLDYEV